MIKLVKPRIEHKEKYKEMIKEQQDFDGPYVPFIIDYGCNNPIEKLDFKFRDSIISEVSKKIICYTKN